MGVNRVRHDCVAGDCSVGGIRCRVRATGNDLEKKDLSRLSTREGTNIKMNMNNQQNYSRRTYIKNTMSQELLNNKQDKVMDRSRSTDLAVSLDHLALEAQQALSCKGSFEKAINMGIAMNRLREALTPAVMESIMKLKGSQLGFRTDECAGSQYKEGISYGVDEVRECLIVATCMGLSPVGNQWNILAGRTYVTKEGMTFLLKNLDGLRNLKMVYHPAEIRESSTAGVSKQGKEYQRIEREGLVRVDMSWEFRGVADAERLEFCIRVNNGMSQDAIIGKAERKAKAWLYSHLTDTVVADGDVEDGGREVRNVTPEAVGQKPRSSNPLAGEAVLPPPVESEVVAVSVADLERLLSESGVTMPQVVKFCRGRQIDFVPGSSREETFPPKTLEWLVANFDQVVAWVGASGK